MNPDFWTMERLDALFAMVMEGKTFGYAAAVLGCTRNAAIGKYNRTRVARGIHTRKPRPRIIGAEQAPRTPKVAPLVKLPVLVPPPLVPAGPAVGIIEVTGCRYSTADDPKVVGGMVFCNAPQDGTRPYCAHHAAIAYTKAQTGNKHKKYRTIPTSLLRMGAR